MKPFYRLALRCGQWFRQLPLRKIARWIVIVAFVAALVSLSSWWLYQMKAARNADNTANVSCTLSFGQRQNIPMSYIQYNIREQAVEPYFKGDFFINLGDIPAGAELVTVTTTGRGHYANTTTQAHFVRSNFATAFWMTNWSTEIPYYRVSGSIKDFPFDSGKIEFDTTFEPHLPIDVVFLRNYSPEFYIPCDAARASREASGNIHVTFEMKRNRLIQLTAVTLLAGLTIFVFVIPFTVKPESLATSVASFFFSMWSVRAILSPETKVFPTLLDLSILFLCVLLLFLLAFKFLLRWVTPRKA